MKTVMVKPYWLIFILILIYLYNILPILKEYVLNFSVGCTLLKDAENFVFFSVTGRVYYIQIIFIFSLPTSRYFTSYLILNRYHRRRSSVNFRAHDILPEKYVWKINKMPEFYMILVRKNIKIPEFCYDISWFLPQNGKNIRILHKICPQIFFPNWGKGHVPPAPPPLPPVSYAYNRYKVAAFFSFCYSSRIFALFRDSCVILWRFRARLYNG